MSPRATMPDTEDQRLAALYDLNILDSLPKQEFSDLVHLASTLCGTPMALISLVDQERQWFLAKTGLDVAQTSRDVSFCAHAILDPEQMLIVEDATQDARFADNELVTGEFNLRFYAGMPLVTSGGAALGSFCVLDTKPHTMQPSQTEALHALARTAIKFIEEHSLMRTVAQKQKYLELAEDIADMGHWRLDLQTNELYWSPGIFKIHGVTPEIYQPQVDSAVEFYHPEDRASVQDFLATAVAHKTDFEFTRRLLRPDGQVVQVRSIGRCELDASGTVVALFGVFKRLSNQTPVA